jgi:hypothetical protein
MLLGLYGKRKAGYLNTFSMPSLPKEVLMGIFDEKSTKIGNAVERFILLVCVASSTLRTFL